MYLLVDSGPLVAERIALVAVGPDAIGKGLATVDTARFAVPDLTNNNKHWWYQHRRGANLSRRCMGQCQS